MRLPLFWKLFLTLTLSAGLVVGAMSLAMRLSVSHEFSKYLEGREAAELQMLAAGLSAEYHEAEGWMCTAIQDEANALAFVADPHLRNLADQAPFWVTTEKDAVKLDPTWLPNLQVLGIDLVLSEPFRFEEFLSGIVEEAISLRSFRQGKREHGV